MIRRWSDREKEALRHYFAYDADTGQLSWRYSRRGVRSLLCNSVNAEGYIYVRLQGIRYLGHHVCWFLFYDEPPSYMLDHVDQDKTNNRIKNLRETDHQSNALNTAPAKVKGVYVTGSGKYAAKCCGNYLGSFPTREEAEASYLKYRKRKMENEHAFF